MARRAFQLMLLQSLNGDPPLAIAMIATVDGSRCLRRYRLVVAQKSKSYTSVRKLPQRLPHGLIPASLRVDSSRALLIENSSMAVQQMVIDRPYRYVLPMMELRYQAIHDKKIIAIPGIHYFDAHQPEALLLTASELQLHPRLVSYLDCKGFVLTNAPLPFFCK